MSSKNITQEEMYWNDFYSKKEFEIPSQFCALLAAETSQETPIVEFGCGNGRDSLFLARHGYNICAVDLSSKAIEKCMIKSKEISNITFRQGDVSIEDDVRNPIMETKMKHGGIPIVIYSRFFLHSIDQEQEQLFLSYLSNYLDTGDSVYLEFRSKEDETIDKIYGNHYRRYIDTDKFVSNLNLNCKFDILYRITSQGVAKYKSEDPFVSRIIALKR